MAFFSGLGSSFGRSLDLFQVRKEHKEEKAMMMMMMMMTLIAGGPEERRQPQPGFGDGRVCGDMADQQIPPA